MTYGLTHKQDEALRFIETYLGEHNVPPSYAEIAAGIGSASKSRVHHLLNGLEERGLVRRLPNRARTIQVVKLDSRPDLQVVVLPDGTLDLTWGPRVGPDWVQHHGHALKEAISRKIAAAVLGRPDRVAR